MAKFFFWSGGTLLQKSVEGLLRSLLWQILQELPSVTAVSLRHSGRKNSTLQNSMTMAAWTPRRLQTTLEDALRQASRSYRIYFFIDRLDEHEGDQDGLVSFIQGVVQSADVKICLSSRPDRAFDEAFGSSAKLRLQDLTRNDILKFVVDELQSVPQAQAIALQDPDLLDNIKEDIVERAQGVFLWVSLVVKDLVKGLRNDDSPKQLAERLASLPGEVEGIYERMLDHIEKPHRREAAQWLSIVLHFRLHDQYDNLSLLQFVLAAQEQLDEMIGSHCRMPELELVATSRRVRKRIGTVCAGLLEIHDEASTGVETLGPEGDFVEKALLPLYSETTVDFIHRTALDFMRDRGQGGVFLEANLPLEFIPQVTLAQVSIGILRLFGCRDRTVTPIMREISRAENQTGVAQLRLCELLDITMSRIDRTDVVKNTDSHWSARWGPVAPRDILLHPLRTGLSVCNGKSEYGGSSQAWTNNKYCVKQGLHQRDFLSLAASCGLCLYVQHVLHYRTAPLEKDTASRLLYWSVFSLEITIIRTSAPAEEILSSLSLVNELLKRGGNPNLGAPHSTTWIWFLLAMLYLHINEALYNGPRYVNKAEKIKIQTMLMRTTLAFIENGADLHVICSLDLREDSPWGHDDEFRFKLDLSAIVVIEICLHDQPELSYVRNKGLAEGVRYYSRCTQLAVYSYSRRPYVNDEREESDKESVEQGNIGQEGFNLQDVRSLKKEPSPGAFDGDVSNDQGIFQDGDERAYFSDDQQGSGQEDEGFEDVQGSIASDVYVSDDQEDFDQEERSKCLAFRSLFGSEPRVYDLREEESEALLEIFNRDLSDPKAKELFRLHIEDLGREILQDRLESSSQTAGQ